MKSKRSSPVVSVIVVRNGRELRPTTQSFTKDGETNLKYVPKVIGMGIEKIREKGLKLSTDSRTTLLPG